MVHVEVLSKGSLKRCEMQYRIWTQATFIFLDMEHGGLCVTVPAIQELVAVCSFFCPRVLATWRFLAGSPLQASNFVLPPVETSCLYTPEGQVPWLAITFLDFLCWCPTCSLLRWHRPGIHCRWQLANRRNIWATAIFFLPIVPAHPEAR